MTTQADRERVAMAALTVDECLEACLMAASTFWQSADSYEKNAPWNEVYGMQQRREDFLTEAAEHHMVEAHHFRGAGHPVRMLYHLLQWRTCREALRAIEAERGERGRP